MTFSNGNIKINTITARAYLPNVLCLNSLAIAQHNIMKKGTIKMSLLYSKTVLSNASRYERIMIEKKVKSVIMFLFLKIKYMDAENMDSKSKSVIDSILKILSSA